MDIGRHLKVTDFEVDEKSNGTLVLAVKLVGVYGEEHVEVVQICSETWHAWILFSGRIVEFCQNKNVHPYEGQLTLPVTDGIRVSDQNALLISSTGCITLVDWFNDCIITLVSNSVINNMDIKHNYLIYVETIDNCTRLVTIDLDVIWSSSIFLPDASEWTYLLCQSVPELFYDAPTNHLESANPLGNVSACFSLKPLAVDNINEEKCGAEAVRKVAVDTLSSTLCWSSYMDDKIRISFFD
ncbi:hypothetical protein EW145_g6596 [Phellinidium pouzarii]|uniref:Uncharacterized protein n=1 Tax=Phellinidium pouzarii TaxID=167371 RepID=A0A4S4KW43_9AGAM|nr:hypothetical protein EW145_g6596 [Phellinidium pouzarii]